MRLALALALGTALATSGLAQAQTPPAPAASAQYNAPRTAFGQPDLQSVWSNASLTPLSPPPLKVAASASPHYASGVRKVGLAVAQDVGIAY